jgi:rod shape-determining protein MreD
MGSIKQKNFFEKILLNIPVILLFISVLNEFDFNYLDLEFFSFNFTHILIFYYSLKKSKSLGYGLIFIAGLLNDVVVGVPIGISSLMYLLICGFASYLRNITLRPSLTKDWIFFLITILVTNSLTFIILILIFDYQLVYYQLLINIFFTFIFYFFFNFIFDFYERLIFGNRND